MTKQALLIFTKNPEAGKVKTRLAATIGNDNALHVYERLVQHTIRVTNSLPVDKILFYSDFISDEDLWNSEHYLKQVQNGKHLGERMNNAFSSAFKNGYDRMVIIGTDCPQLNAEIIMNAFAYLNKYDVVIGPAEDGGYYLLGLRHPCLQIFEDIHWSTDTVFDETAKKCIGLQLSYVLLPVLNDIDDEMDLLTSKWQKE
jgi:rSAM/selenodomain-associated transferase 1